MTNRLGTIAGAGTLYGPPVPRCDKAAMTTSSATPDQQVDRIPVRIWSMNGHRDEVGVHFRDQDLQACGLRDGDRLVLDINGAVVRGDVCIDLKGPWLGTQKLRSEGWSHRRITDALRAVGVDNPSEHVALIVERNGVVLPATEPHELHRRAAALAAAGVSLASTVDNTTPTRFQRVVQEFARSPAVVAEVLRIAAGRCELCECAAPFLRADASPYLEVHHVRTLAENGPDRVDNAVALCPTCHRLLHHAGALDREAALSRLLSRATRLSAASSPSTS